MLFLIFEKYDNKRPDPICGYLKDLTPYVGTRRNLGTNFPIGKGPSTQSDIDYLVPPSSAKYFEGLQGKLPGLDPKSGIIPGNGNNYIGPTIRFEPTS